MLFSNTTDKLVYYGKNVLSKVTSRIINHFRKITDDVILSNTISSLAKRSLNYATMGRDIESISAMCNDELSILRSYGMHFAHSLFVRLCAIAHFLVCFSRYFLINMVLGF